MHELSIAQSLIDLACETAAREGASQVLRLHARIGAFSGVDKQALQFSFELAAEDSACAGATLEIEDVALTVMCPRCGEPKTPVNHYSLLCPTCGAPTPEILSGRELQLVSLEVQADEAACA